MNEPRQAQETSKPKIGQGHASAMGRMGGKELSAILPAFPDSVQPIDEYGAFGTQLPSEIAKGREGPRMEPNHNIGMEM